jgi:hypothetical protein
VIALAASVVVTLYLLIPSSIFRFVFGLFVPLRSFVRTRGEEIFQGVKSVVAPIILALILAWTTPPFKEHPFSFADTSRLRRADYELVVSALYSEAIFRQNADAFWKAMTRTGRRQGRFLAWYYVLVIAEGFIFGGLSISYPALIGPRWYNRRYEWFAEKVLLPNISEWHVLFTSFFFRDKRTVVRADILCADNTLYSGRVTQHSLDKEGQLAGVIITEAKRYARDAYLKDKEKGSVKKKDYWRPIPGAKLYIFADKILNLNLTYEGPVLPPNVIADVISRLLKRKILIEMKPSPERPNT